MYKHAHAHKYTRTLTHELMSPQVILACPIAFGLSFINSGPAELWWEWLLWTVQVSPCSHLQLPHPPAI